MKAMRLFIFYFVIAFAHVQPCKSNSENSSEADIEIEYRGSFGGSQLWVIRYEGRLLAITCGKSEIHAIRVSSMFPLSVTVDQMKNDNLGIVIYLAREVSLVSILRIENGRLEIVDTESAEILTQRWNEESKLMNKGD